MPRRKSVPPSAARAAASAPSAAAEAVSIAPRVLHRGELARIELIHERLRAVRPDNTVKVTALSLARELGRSRSLIFETLDKMKVVFGAPIAYDPVRGTQYYAQAPGAPPFELHPRVSLDARQALALMVAARRLFPFGATLQAAMGKVVPVLDGAATLDPTTLDTICSAPEQPATEADAENFVFLFYAILRRQEIRFTYAKAHGDTAAQERTVRPLHLVIFADSCLLVAHDPAARDRRNFELARLRDPQLTGATFVPPAGFDLKKYLAGGMGRFLGEPQHTVHLRFAPSYVRLVKERPWHRPQILKPRADGSAETTYRVAHTKEIEQRVLAAAGQVEVLSPPDLRARVRAAAEAVLKGHG